MKLIIILLLLNISKTVSGNVINDNIFNAKQVAFSEIFQELFNEYKKPVDVIIYENSPTDVDNILRILQRNHLMRIQVVKDKNYKLFPTGQTLIFPDEIDDIQNLFLKSIRTNKVYVENKFLVYTKNLEVNRIDPAVPMFRMGHPIEHSYFIMEDDDEIQLKTFEWWTEEACNVTQLITINSYSKKSLNWQKPLTIPKKFTNFHNCTFVTVTSMHRTLIIDMSVETVNVYSDSDAFNGRLQWKFLLDDLLMEIFAEKGNYTAIQAFFKTDPGLQIYQVTETFTEKEDFYSGHLPYYETSNIIMIPVAGSYNSYEKLLLPFDKTTWILLILTFGAAILLIVVLNLLSFEHQRHIIGDRIQSSHIDVLSIFFGISQNHSPQKNASRIVLITFLMFCLVIRTAYQGVFFELFSTDIKKPIPEKLTDLKSFGYTWYVLNDNLNENPFENQLSEMELKEEELPKIVQTGAITLPFLISQLFDPTSKTAIICPSDQDTMNRYYLRHEKEFPNAMKKKLTSKFIGLSLYKNHFISYTTIKTMKRLIEAGIPQWSYNFLYVFLLDPRIPPEDKNPKVFNLDDLSFGFIIWLYACAIAVCVFAAEILVHYIPLAFKFVLQELIALYLLLKILNLRLRSFHG